MIAEKVWPGTISHKIMFRHHYLRFLEEAYRQVTSPSSSDSFQDLQPLRYALASVMRYLAPEFIDSRTERFDTKVRKKLFELLFSWCDDSGGTWGPEDYRREVERYESRLLAYTTMKYNAYMFHNSIGQIQSNLYYTEATLGTVVMVLWP